MVTEATAQIALAERKADLPSWICRTWTGSIGISGTP